MMQAGGAGAATGPLMYPMNIGHDMMFTHMASSGGPPANSLAGLGGGGHASSGGGLNGTTSTCQQTQDRQDITSSMLEQNGECGTVMLPSLREHHHQQQQHHQQHFGKFNPARNQSHYMY
ncbi:hypothetical protein HELRODRAFT_195143 [Helobdella robusta]|uniref:Uncharacterized protein n=1 Tax=Helobdella robusta TaxID=6412 RepID=T1FWT0_HELRO|nr:hypothetical protein HELRODRAFT_195143 [Helobdella robusta]ESN90765.1 hypothetical protein HELRODRAFT_195143 [Helobdella robusta]